MEYRFSANDSTKLAAKKVGIDGWEGYIWEAKEGGSLITGCVPDGVYSKGPRKGNPRFSKPIPGTKKQVIVSFDDLKAEAERYERDLNLCWDCKGAGEVFKSWHYIDGVTNKVCSKCHGKCTAR